MELSRMGLKHAIGVDKVRAAIEADGGMTIYAAHLLPHLSSFIPPILAAGIRLVELSHTSIIMERRPPPRASPRWRTLQRLPRV